MSKELNTRFAAFTVFKLLEFFLLMKIRRQFGLVKFFDIKADMKFAGRGVVDIVHLRKTRNASYVASIACLCVGVEQLWKATDSVLKSHFDRKRREEAHEQEN